LQPILTERQRELVDLAGRLADEFAEAAGLHDRENTFPVENWDRMRDEGYLNLTVPEELGGLGGGLLDLFVAQERLAMGDGSTALAVNMHVSPCLQVAMAWRQTRDPLVEEFLRGIARGEIVMASCTSEPGFGGALWDCATTATKADGGYRLNGRKIFFTESAVATHFVINAKYDDPETGPRMVFFRTALDKDGFTIKQTWDTLGMRATQSNDLLVEDAFVADEELFHSYPVGHFDARLMLTVFTVAVPSFGAIALGIAAGGMAWAREQLRERGRHHDSEVQHLFAEMEVLLESGRAVLYRHAVEAESGEVPKQLTVQEGMARGNLAKYVAANNAVEIMNRVMHVVGGVGYFRRFPIERMYRDVRAPAIMPFNNLEAHKLFGYTSLGIPIAPVIDYEESGLDSRPKEGVPLSL
jgi:alkylation response protein AidB-like acyl-CoA dehydrogenase